MRSSQSKGWRGERDGGKRESNNQFDYKKKCVQNRNEKTFEITSEKAVQTVKQCTKINNTYMIWRAPGTKVAQHNPQKNRPHLAIFDFSLPTSTAHAILYSLSTSSYTLLCLQ